MTGFNVSIARVESKSWLDRSLSVFADVRAGEGATALLMLVNVFLLLICYSVIKTVREPLILLGGGAEVRSYAAAGQALMLMGFVPLYSWFASRVNRSRLLVCVTTFFIVCIELFAAAVAARVPYVGVAFFIWVGIFNMSLVAQFWSFANDIYAREAGDRLFPFIMIGMTAGAPLGSIVAGRLFRLGLSPQLILQVSAFLLAVSVCLYAAINRRASAQGNDRQVPLAAGDGFRLVLANPYLRLIALLVVLLNVVNTTGEYMVARLLTLHVKELALVDVAFNKQAFIGAFTGEYQFWVGVTAFMLQAFVASRLVKYRGLAGVLLALPLIALGGYAIVAAGVGFSVVRWVKTAENATDYSIMNTARQLLWLQTSPEEKYKAKQAIDTFFVRGGDVLSAGVVLLGTKVLHLSVAQFALGNIALTFVWLFVAFRLISPTPWLRFATRRPVAGRAMAAGAAVLMLVVGLSSPAAAQVTRADEQAAERAAKATRLSPPAPDALERRLEMVDRALSSDRPLYLHLGGPIDGSGFALGPGYRGRFGDDGSFDTHASYSLRNYKGVEGRVTLPSFADGRAQVGVRGQWFDAPRLAYFGVGNDTPASDRSTFGYTSASAGAAATLRPARHLSFGGSFDLLDLKADGVRGVATPATEPVFGRTTVGATVEFGQASGYTTRGGLYTVELSDYRQVNNGNSSFRRVDAEVRQFVPILHENWVLAFRALASTTQTTGGNSVPDFMLPDLGGSETLRGYSAWRFRDRSRLLLSGEYRWAVAPLLDMAVFMDAGKVAPSLTSLGLSGLKYSEGIGVRLHSFTNTLTRIEVARSKEGTSLIVAFSPSF